MEDSSERYWEILSVVSNVRNWTLEQLGGTIKERKSDAIYSYRRLKNACRLLPTSAGSPSVHIVRGWVRKLYGGLR